MQTKKKSNFSLDECGTQYQSTPSLYQRPNGYMNNRTIPSFAYPMQNTSSVQATTSPGPVETTTYCPSPNGLFMPNQSQSPVAATATHLPPNQQNNVQYVLCLDQTVFLPDRFEVCSRFIFIKSDKIKFPIS